MDNPKLAKKWHPPPPTFGCATLWEARYQRGLASRKPPKPNLRQHEPNMDQLIPGRSEKPNPHLILPFFGLPVASFPSLTGPNLQAALASTPTSDRKMHTKRARDGHPQFARARLDRFGHFSDPLLTLRGASSGLFPGNPLPFLAEPRPLGGQILDGISFQEASETQLTPT